MTDFPPTRAAALDRLHDFVPLAGFSYAKRRNFDLPGHPGVSRLSPYLRHRVITEEEVLSAVLAQHSAQEAEKFIAEVCWRTYWKGVLQLRPALWTAYKAELQGAWNQVQTNAGLRANWEAACKGETGIDCFDHWARELVTTGYLHNHARMWFASIWIFTLRLPWTLGADFFLRHLLDGDPASNTLSWRWVGGLQTKGKTYLARPDNIAKFTQDRFDPTDLATIAAPLKGPDLPEPVAIPLSDPLPQTGKIGLLMTEEDMSPGWRPDDPNQVVFLTPRVQYGPLKTAHGVIDFKSACLASAVPADATSVSTPQDITGWALDHDLTHVRMAITPTGPVADALVDLRKILTQSGITLTVQINGHDAGAWPHATRGFFRFKSVIPDLLHRLS